jgi:hypothetical protein
MKVLCGQEIAADRRIRKGDKKGDMGCVGMLGEG